MSVSADGEKNTFSIIPTYAQQYYNDRRPNALSVLSNIIIYIFFPTEFRNKYFDLPNVLRTVTPAHKQLNYKLRVFLEIKTKEIKAHYNNYIIMGVHSIHIIKYAL